MKRLSKEAEEKLVSAVEQVADLVSNEGMTPTDALVKIANDEGLLAGHVRLVANAYNTGKTNAHRQTAADVWEKAAEIPLADAGVAIDKLFTTKKASPVSKQNIEDYTRPPVWADRLRKDRFVAATPLEKYASAPKPKHESEELTLRKQAADKSKSEKKVVEKRARVSLWTDRVMQSTEELRDYFKTPGNLPFNEVRKTAEALHGEDAAKLFAFLERKNPSFAKQAGKAVDLAKGEVFDIINNAVIAGRGYRISTSNYEDQSKFHDFMYGKQASAKPNKPEHVLEVPGWTEKPAEKKAEGGEDNQNGVLGCFLKKEAILGLQTMKAHGQRTAKILGDTSGLKPGAYETSGEYAPGHSIGNTYYPSTATEFDKGVRPEMLAWELSSPEHENDLRSVQVNGWMHDLMANDQVVGQHQVDEVSKAYNDLSKLAPRAMGNPMIAKMMMSTYLSQGGRVGLFDAQGGLAQLLDVENRIKQRDAYPGVTDPFAGPTMPKSEEFR